MAQRASPEAILFGDPTDSQIFQRIISYGPDCLIPQQDFDELILSCAKSSNADIVNAGGWLALEQSFYFSSIDNTARTQRALARAHDMMSLSVDMVSPDSSGADETSASHRIRLALSSLPIYALLARNQPVLPGDIKDLQKSTAINAIQLLHDAREARAAGNDIAAGDLDGLIGELDFQMAFNRVPMSGPDGEGIVGFALSTTFRQDKSPHSVADKKSHILNPDSLLKRNWDTSIVIRESGANVRLADAIGWLGKTAALRSGLYLHTASRWRYASRIQVKSKLNILNGADSALSKRQPRIFTNTGGNTRDQVILPVRLGMMQTQASAFDQTHITVYGIAEELGLTEAKQRADILQLLVSEARGNDALGIGEKQRLKGLSKRLRSTLQSRIAA